MAPHAWLLPLLPRVARAAAAVFYRITVAGVPVPAEGPVILVANHPNGLLDPVLVAAVAGRPVRFLAKAPLVADRRIGWLLRAAGSIPVFRQQDDPSAMGGNREMFRAAGGVLAGGAALAVFPEGVSHSAPAIAELRTGAARIALSDPARAAATIVPVGLVLRDKERFRSEALVVIGHAVAWDDLRVRSSDDPATVRALTARIDAALRTVTLNLEQWEDAPLIECAEAVYVAERSASTEPATRLERLRVAARVLSEVRNDRAWAPLFIAIRRHAQALAGLHLSPTDLHAATDFGTATRWALRRVPLALLPVLLIGAASHLAWWPPYRLTGLLAAQIPGTSDVRATYKFGVGAVLYALWTVLVAIIVGSAVSPAAGFATLLLLPALGVAGLWIREHYRAAWLDARRFFLLRRH
ncbi:MAG: 1-acyl-sn-glycerol-3-phosphate acyltransferase, partial [Gemmatimonadales bacterium]|nr:1-acyl-sn-glycerol-3-phosphate acyltransferase [Gemmatimonadales bacterium]